MMTKSAKTDIVHRFFSGTGYSYDQVAGIWTFGFDKYWKKKIIAKIPLQSNCIIDQGCGTGILTLVMARKFPNSRIIGVELRDEYLNIAREKARISGIKNVKFVLGRAEDVMIQGGCDCITSSYLAKYAEIKTLIANAKKMLQPDGLLIIHDFTSPKNPLFQFLWRVHFQIMKIIGSKLYPEWRTVFHELQPFLRQTMWIDDLLVSLRENNFSEIKCESFTFGTAAIVTAKKPASPIR